MCETCFIFHTFFTQNSILFYFYILSRCRSPNNRYFAAGDTFRSATPSSTSAQEFPGVRLNTPSWISTWRPNIRMVERYRNGRVFLAGDATHVHFAAGGQGLNTGVQDAYNLGRKLASVLHGASDTLLDTYQEERLPIA